MQDERMPKLLAYHPRRADETDHEHDRAQTTEEVHRFLSETEYVGDRQQIQEPIDEPIEAELGGAVLTRMMLDHLLTDLPETLLLCNERNVPVHIT